MSADPILLNLTLEVSIKELLTHQGNLIRFGNPMIKETNEAVIEFISELLNAAQGVLND